MYKYMNGISSSCLSGFIANMPFLFFPPAKVRGLLFILSCFFLFGSSSSSWCPTHYVLQRDRLFEQKTDRFWEYEGKSNSWVEVELPYDLVSCVEGNCTKVGSISSRKGKNKEKGGGATTSTFWNEKGVVPVRKRLVSLRKMSETSIWVTGQSGSIYERFWNGVQWVIAPHDLNPSSSAAPAAANSVFVVNHTILALSEAGTLYQMQLSENSQPVWVDFSPTADPSTISSALSLKSGLFSNDDERVYFCTRNGSLLELSGIEPPRWLNHGRPPGANVAAIADAGAVRQEVIFTISSSGDLYEYDRSSKPSWKKHIWRSDVDTAEKTTSLKPLTGSVIVHGLNCVSLFLLTKGGDLVERRLNQRKWKWVVHGVPEEEHLFSINAPSQDVYNDKSSPSLFLTAASGNVWEYRVPNYAGSSQDSQIGESWVNHMHPPHAKVATSPSSGLQFQFGRIFFPLEDGRLAELHLSGLGGKTIGPLNPYGSLRRKASSSSSSRPKYVWSVLDAPETEGWNAEYCSEERGPTNCIIGINDELTRGRKVNTVPQNYLIPSPSENTPWEEYKMPDKLINMNFHLRVMHVGKSFFLITDEGLTFEYLNTEQNVWLWLRHNHESSLMRGAVGDYNGSLFLVDEHGSLLMMERNGNELVWINCTALKKGKQISGGPPWNSKLLGISGSKITAEDSLFFLSKTGRLLQFTVALRKFKWKDCKYPATTKVAIIVDQEVLRDNIVFVIGRNGRLYQYNKVTEVWHEHRQSQHLILSRTVPGTAMRPSLQSTKGSLFMLDEDGGLIEYQWEGGGWDWVEHGTPHRSVSLVGSPGPCFHGNQLFLIGSDGNVHLRYFDGTMWRWKNCGVPYVCSNDFESVNGDICMDDSDMENFEESHSNCDSKVAPIRPIPFSDDSVIFELRDGRLAEMRWREKIGWMWSRTIGTPSSSCVSHFWTGIASS